MKIIIFSILGTFPEGKVEQEAGGQKLLLRHILVFCHPGQHVDQNLHYKNLIYARTMSVGTQIRMLEKVNTRPLNLEDLVRTSPVPKKNVKTKKNLMPF